MQSKMVFPYILWFCVLHSSYHSLKVSHMFMCFMVFYPSPLLEYEVYKDRRFVCLVYCYIPSTWNVIWLINESIPKNSLVGSWRKTQREGVLIKSSGSGEICNKFKKGKKSVYGFKKRPGWGTTSNQQGLPALGSQSEDVWIAIFVRLICVTISPVFCMLTHIGHWREGRREVNSESEAVSMTHHSPLTFPGSQWGYLVFFPQVSTVEISPVCSNTVLTYFRPEQQF